MPSVILKPGREKSVLRRHPWIFSGAIKLIEGSPQTGETVEVLSSEGKWLAFGAYSPTSQIPVRIWTFSSSEKIGLSFFFLTLKRAVEARRTLTSSHQFTAFRMVNAESDGIPGLIVDRYGEFLVCQFLTAGTEFWKNEIISALNEIFPSKGIFERSDVDVRRKEGLPPATGVLCGLSPPNPIEIKEGNTRFLVDVYKGHKTGFYLDQRENRMAVADYSHGADVLNAFSYTGGFGIWCLKGGAKHVTHIDTSKNALSVAKEHADINGFTSEKVTYLEADVFQVLRRFRESSHRFDIVILDPPKFIESKSHLKQGSRGYKDINMLAFQLLNPCGLLFTFSCSGHMESDLFQKVVAGAALDAGRDARIIRRVSQPSDHPVALNFPEGDYLKGLLVRVC
ncbi:MAG: class I SAM-dependent methyltransferase [Pseudomonadota bacterium]